GADAGQLQHFIVTDGIHLAGFGDNAWIGGVDAVYVGVDFAADFAVVAVRVVLHDGGQRDGRGVRAAPAQRRDVVVGVDPLKAGDDNDLALVEPLAHPLGRDILDACFGVIAVGDDADLGAG